MTTHNLTQASLFLGMYFAHCSCGHHYASSSDWSLIKKDHESHVAKADHQDSPTDQQD